MIADTAVLERTGFTLTRGFQRRIKLAGDEPNRKSLLFNDAAKPPTETLLLTSH